MTGMADFQKILQLASEAYQQCAHLPFAAYLVSRDGTFLRYNEEARSLFDLPVEPSFRDNITQYYLHPGDREENLRRLSQVPKGQWLKDTTMDLKIGPAIRHVRDYSMAIWEEEKDGLAAILCLIVNMTKSDRYHRLFSDLPMGVFSFRVSSGLVNANPRFCEMHGYLSLEEIRHKAPSAFMKNVDELKNLTRRLVAEGAIVNVYQENIRRDGTTFTASVSAKAVRSNDGHVIGFDGIVEDVSLEDIYFKLVNEVPIGLFKVRINHKGAHILVHCNRHFAKNRGADFPEKLIGKDLRDFHRSEADFDRFFNQLIRQDEKGESLVEYIMEAVNGQGDPCKYELYAKLLKEENGEIIGMVGAERDVTDYWDTKQQLDELTTDFGKVLHSYSSTLINSKHTMSSVIRSFRADAEKLSGTDQLDRPLIMEKINNELAALDGTIQSMLEKNEAVAFFDERTAHHFSRLMELMRSDQATEVNIQRLAIVRDGSIRIKELSRDLRKGNFPRELIKQLKRQLQEILRLCSLITLTHGVEAVLEMETGVNNLRSYILTRVKQKEKIKKLDIYDLLLGVAKNMSEYASKRNVELRMNLKEISKVYIHGYREELTRALLNVVHNAIKYSWSRRSPARSFVKIEGRTDFQWLYLEVENWGVAITPKELKDKLIFKVGYRGANSRDRRRPGTGLGLYDSLKVIKKHQGKLNITSKPSLGNPEDDYSKPFVTNVTIQLPLIKPEI